MGAHLAATFPQQQLGCQGPRSPDAPCCFSLLGSESRWNDIKTEPGTLFFTPAFGSSPNGPRSGLISVAITLHPTAAENISSVVAAFSDLLHVRIPNSYEVSTAPDVPPAGLVSGHRVTPCLEYRPHVFLRGPPPGSANPPRLAASYRLKPPSAPFPPTSNGELVCVLTHIRPRPTSRAFAL